MEHVNPLTRETGGESMRIIISIVLLIFLVSPAFAGDEVPEYRLQVGDQIRFLVWGESGLGTTTQVLTDGSVSFPLVGRLLVVGMTLGEVEDECRVKLAKYLIGPIVNVVVTTPHVPRVKVLGRVASPGKFVIQPDDTLIDAIAYAGGFDERCDIKRILILNRGTAKLINLRDYLDNESGVPEGDLTINDGDLIIVPEVSRVDWGAAMPFITAAIQSLIMSR